MIACFPPAAPTNPCDPNPCGVYALCEIDQGSAVCFCPKGMTGNPFRNCGESKIHSDFCHISWPVSSE